MGKIRTKIVFLLLTFILICVLGACAPSLPKNEMRTVEEETKAFVMVRDVLLDPTFGTEETESEADALYAFMEENENLSELSLTERTKNQLVTLVKILQDGNDGADIHLNYYYVDKKPFDLSKPQEEGYAQILKIKLTEQNGEKTGRIEQTIKRTQDRSVTFGSDFVLKSYDEEKRSFVLRISSSLSREYGRDEETAETKKLIRREQDHISVERGKITEWKRAVFQTDESLFPFENLSERENYACKCVAYRNGKKYGSTQTWVNERRVDKKKREELASFLANDKDFTKDSFLFPFSAIIVSDELGKRTNLFEEDVSELFEKEEPYVYDELGYSMEAKCWPTTFIREEMNGKVPIFSEKEKEYDVSYHNEGYAFVTVTNGEENDFEEYKSVLKNAGFTYKEEYGAFVLRDEEDNIFIWRKGNSLILYNEKTESQREETYAIKNALPWIGSFVSAKERAFESASDAAQDLGRELEYFSLGSYESVKNIVLGGDVYTFSYRTKDDIFAETSVKNDLNKYLTKLGFVMNVYPEPKAFYTTKDGYDYLVIYEWSGNQEYAQAVITVYRLKENSIEEYIEQIQGK